MKSIKLTIEVPAEIMGIAYTARERIKLEPEESARAAFICKCREFEEHREMTFGVGGKEMKSLPILAVVFQECASLCIRLSLIVRK